MADPKGFLTTPRETPELRPVAERVRDWKEVYKPFPHEKLEQQAGRCMDCGIPFCHNACPLGNLIPEWNDLTWRSDWREAIERLHATNNFPEFTGRLCPAPCEAACVLSIDPDQTGGPVTIKLVEHELADRAWDEGWVTPQIPGRLSGKTVAVVGSGPAGLAAAQQLTRAGHTVVVYERADRIGGLLRYGIPEFKMEKWVLDRRLAQMEAEGTRFRPNVHVGVDISARELKSRYDAVVLAIGATVPRDLPAPGRELRGIHQAMEYLPIANRVQQGDLAEPTITAKDKRVVIIGGGDTGADCLGTAHRQGAKSVVQLEILPRPPLRPAPSTPWPTWPLMLRTSTAHEEGGERRFSVNTLEFLGDGAGNVRALRLVEVRMVDGRFEPIPGTEQELPADLVLLAMGFLGPERTLIEQFGLQTDVRGNIARDESYATNVPGVFVCGDAGRGQSLIVWAIAEGRAAAAAVDRFLTGVPRLPVPIAPSARPLT
ncbi:glutamate synthase (NADH) small subunit [Acidothermus cellulolyticus 11B]|jgi:glutamate synthase (NADPH/NADH) small chain|uniref:Glutamate synthase (NADH) small subunit n=1 Tax=Acidothermus cellulolyticus (strain ATCC 43068 / DSM 8971 / 11B) TaxID=351607 RepID=A0LTU1_ACIC1|nr:glutamate synthase subunit beta [Acidothermus cellulolyticus]ABK52851.1 glutamate synthase (NADH) small subunit [Acidothermus cellulolyticus 11B]MBX5447189.1 glutamate synthase subunit beta [Acidothermus cellulolyticus]